MKVRVNVAAQSGVSAILSSPILTAVIIAVIAGAVYSVYKYRRKST
jgi:hypothetical protein